MMPPRGGSHIQKNQTMDNPRLAVRSEVFTDDDGIKISKRCYFLAIGDDDHQGNAFSVVLSFNIFDEPAMQKKIEVKVKLSNVIVELCPEVLKSITQLIPEFKAMFRFKDLCPNNKDTARRIELMAPLHLLSELTMPSCLNANDMALANEVNNLRQYRANSKTEEEKKKLETYRDRVMIKKLKQLDI
mmetsp:Transcript_34268/g.42336  ORF Transcript_34268/g.42336 Transcript_34268/m.42336 type:complete len:187 (+) Transcript_34268:2243-2803(+)